MGYPGIAIVTLILSAVSGVLYRLGGWSKGNRLFRILGVPLCLIGAVIALFGLNWGFWWAYLVTFGLCAGAVSAYFGFDEERFGYFAHGFALSLAVLPIAFVTGHWIGFTLRCIILTASITFWSEVMTGDTTEEAGRGVLIILTSPLLVI